MDPKHQLSRIASIRRHLENAGEGVVYPATAGVVGFRFVSYGGVNGHHPGAVPTMVVRT